MTEQENISKREFKWIDIKEWLVVRELQKLQERALIRQMTGL